MANHKKKMHLFISFFSNIQVQQQQRNNLQQQQQQQQTTITDNNLQQPPTTSNNLQQPPTTTTNNNQQQPTTTNNNPTMINILQSISNSEEKRIHEIELQDVKEHDEDAEAESDSPQFQSILNSDNPNSSMTTLTGESLASFLDLFRICKPALVKSRKGKKRRIGAMDRLLILLTYYKHYETIDSLALHTKLPISTIHDAILSTAEAIRPILESKYISSPSPAELVAEAKDMMFPADVLVVDSTFLPSQAPLGTFPAAKEWFSVKHANYGIKYQTLHSRKGKVIALSNCYPAATHDLEIYKQEIDTISSLIDNKERYGVMGDKGYTGANGFGNIKVNTPFKRSPRMTLDQQGHNRELARWRVICKNYYGRLKRRYNIAVALYRGDATTHRTHFTNLIALTNRSLDTEPFRREDQRFHLQVESKLQEEGMARKEKEKMKKKQEYVRRKEKRRRVQIGMDHILNSH